MSRANQSSPNGKKDGRTGSTDAQDDVCPVCKSSRYLNANLRLLVNPECWHRMCESCVDRIFSLGPKRCPIPGCQKTLRKAKFRKQTFEDLKVEREVDIRGRVAQVFNKREEDFETLRDYNDFLNMAEDLTFNLVHSIDVEETERKLDKYRKAHQKEIAENAGLAEQEMLSFNAAQKAEKAQAKQRREAARREEAEERKEMEAQKRDVLRRLESGQAPDAVMKVAQAPTIKKPLSRQEAAERQAQLQAASKSNGSTDFVIKGLKSRVKAEPEAPIDPFGGWTFAGRKYYSLQDDYLWSGVQETRKDVMVRAGGYDVDAFTSRALCEAFAGLGVFIADEATAIQKVANEPGSLKAGVKPAQDVKMEDPF